MTTLKEIAKHRLSSQQIVATKFITAQDIVNWMGAMQAQDFAMAKLAVGIRVPNSTEETIDTALNKGEILRTHLLRPTWHFVSADDIYWLLELTASQIKIKLRSSDNRLNLSEKIFTKSNAIIEKAFEFQKEFTREELKTKLKEASIPTDENRLSHLLLHAELDGIICSGSVTENRQSYVILSERIPKKKIFTRDEALAELAKKYFPSRSPATLQDFIWWSGLSTTAARQALESVKSYFVSEKINSEIYWFIDSVVLPPKKEITINLLPSFDEYIISYKDRTAVLPPEHFHRTVTANGIFWPVILLNGQVIGKWKRMSKKDKVFIEIELFQPQNKTARRQIERAANEIGEFLNKETVITCYL